ncbi:hypothetical protein [Candidatus Williamhamiltonella defendens]|uniref:hypothetical protein n=1 Tax=Candidatus Williamhamiltonella defendens TaxID=138072 RepID=UPI00131502D4|nr:hypothetical protein [Candidatus Hamiltonella defensa]
MGDVIQRQADPSGTPRKGFLYPADKVLNLEIFAVIVRDHHINHAVLSLGHPHKAGDIGIGLRKRIEHHSFSPYQ